MPYVVDIDAARARFPDYVFVRSLTPSEQKAAFHVRDGDGNELCLKLIAPNYGRDRLDREIIALQSIQHPNVAQLREYVFSTREGHQDHYIVEEFVVGEDLTDRLRPGTIWPPDEAATFFGQLCGGLAEMKEEGIVHRDLKPSNIRVRRDSSPVIIDFGVARHLELPDLTPTPHGALIGTPKYCAPEQFTGTKHDIDCRTDLFAVGLLMHEALVGRHPFWRPGMDPATLPDAVCNSEDFRGEPDFQALPDRLTLVIGRLLEKTRARRLRSATQLASILGILGRACCGEVPGTSAVTRANAW